MSSVCQLELQVGGAAESPPSPAAQPAVPPTSHPRPGIEPWEWRRRGPQCSLPPSSLQWYTVDGSVSVHLSTAVGGGGSRLGFGSHESPSLELKPVTWIWNCPEAHGSLHRTQPFQQFLASGEQPFFLFRGHFPASPRTTRTHR